LATKHLELQFAIGSSSNDADLVINWSNQSDFKTAITTYNETKDILKTELNIYMKLVLVGGTGPDGDIIGETRYVWDQRIVEVYSHENGVNADFNIIDVAGSKLRAYSRIASTWADSLSAEGNKSNAIQIFDKENKFDFTYYNQRGIKLEVSPDGTTWTTITVFGVDTFDASKTNKIQFRLSVIDPVLYEIYGTDVIETTTPIGTTTKAIIKDIISKIELTGVVASDLITDKIKVTGSTFNLNITEADELYTVSGMSVAEAKTFFEIKYSFDGLTYFNKDEFIVALSALRTTDLNNLNLNDFKVRYEFTLLGSAKYYSLEVFGDPEAVNANVIKDLNTTSVIKTIDLNEYIANVANVKLSNSTLDIVYADELDIVALTTLGVKIQWDYWTLEVGTGNVVRAGWVDTKPTSVALLKNPADLAAIPIAIRFVKIDTANTSIELKDIVENTANELNTSGYAVDILSLREIVEINDKLGVNYKTKGIVGNVISMNVLADLNNVSALASKHLELQFAIGSSSVADDLVINWSSEADFKTAITTYNETKDILKIELNIYMKLVLVGGTGPDGDIIGETRYVWDQRIVEVYSHENGVNADFNTIDVAGSKLRAYSRIASTWADSLSAEGNKSN
ncbi:MAG: hypothetical protein KFW07_02845, partial [Mycoplasmataceae bacterium]|nr:hypothetical protein [Mycoplasmataceae bacterium]